MSDQQATYQATTPQPAQSYQFEGTMTALSSITHFGDSVGGTEAVLRREKILQPDGSVEDVPVISGNSWRGQLRRAGMRAMLESLATLPEMARYVHDGSIRLPPPAYYMLFSGGQLSKDGAGGSNAVLDIGFERTLRALIPLIGVLGCAVGRHILQGKLEVRKFYPVCAETLAVLPDALREHPHARQSIYDALQVESYTRRDDARATDQAERYLLPADRERLEAPRSRKLTNKQTGAADEIAPAPGTAQQMRYGFETYAAGTVFRCGVLLRLVTPLEFEAFWSAIAEWSRDPVLGGRSAIGHGQVRLEFPGWAVANPLLRTDAQATAVGAPFGTRYREHLAAHGGEIVQMLERMA